MSREISTDEKIVYCQKMCTDVYCQKKRKKREIVNVQFQYVCLAHY